MMSKHVADQPARNAASALLFTSLMNERPFSLAVHKTLDAVEPWVLLVIRGCCVQLVSPSRNRCCTWVATVRKPTPLFNHCPCICITEFVNKMTTSTRAHLSFLNCKVTVAHSITTSSHEPPAQIFFPPRDDRTQISSQAVRCVPMARKYT